MSSEFFTPITASKVAGARDELVARGDAPVGMRAEVLRVERQQPLRQVELFARRQSDAAVPMAHQLRRHERRIGARRVRHHQVRLERGVTVASETIDLFIDLGGRHLREIDQLPLDVLLHGRKQLRALRAHRASITR
jgi:hypothetical protein